MHSTLTLCVPSSQKKQRVNFTVYKQDTVLT